MSDAVRQAALDYLATHQVLTLATHGDGVVWAAAVFYVHEGWSLYFLSAGHTRHARNIANQPRVAGTIQEDYRDWGAIKGIQLEGMVTLLSVRRLGRLALGSTPADCMCSPVIKAIRVGEQRASL